MGRTRLASVSSVIGALLITFGIILLLQPDTIHAQDEARAYVGFGECRDCHRVLANDFRDTPHSRTMVEAHDEDIPPLADFSVGEDVRMVQFPDSAEARPFTLEDVAYTLGSGWHIQLYLYEAEEDMLRVLPAAWNTVTNEWQPYTLAESWDDPAYNFNESCAYCHVTGFDAEDLEWQEEGVLCETCHGPGSEHVDLMDEIEFVESPEDREALHGSINIGVDSQTCGQCHSRGASDMAHPYPANYVPGEDLLATFTLAPEDSDAHWYPTGQAALKYMQYNEWLQTGHATSYTSATENENFQLECLECHSAGYRRAVRLLETSNEDPDALPIPEVEAERLPYGVTCSTCHNPHDDSAEEEDYDPVAATYALCTDCHQSAGEIAGLHYPVKEVYEGLPIVEEVEPVIGVHFAAENGPTCTTCHMPDVAVEIGTRSSHMMQTIPPAATLEIEGVQDSCTVCHDLVDGQSMQGLIDAVQTETEERYNRALETVADDTPDWVSASLVAVTNEGSWGVHNMAYTNALLEAVETELGLRETGTAELVLPQIPTQPVPTAVPANVEIEQPNTYVLDLTLPSLILLSIAFGIIIFAGIAFFFGGRDSS